jgi:hypothetical protein
MSGVAAEREVGASPRRVICDTCGRRGWLPAGAEGTCRECGGPYRPMALLEGLVDRWFAPPDHRVSEFYPRHLKLIELMWTADGRGQETFQALGLSRISYSQFVTRATEVVVRGLREGWIEAVIPHGPVQDDDAYTVRFLDVDRWADELTREFFAQADTSTGAPRARLDATGDSDRG